VRSFGRWMILGCWSLLMGIPLQQMHGEGVEVSGKILMSALTQPVGKKHNDAPSVANVVVWLSPLTASGVAPFLSQRVLAV
jgi:hypothetical protein